MGWIGGIAGQEKELIKSRSRLVVVEKRDETEETGEQMKQEVPWAGGK